jgi:hypothetical protein
MFRMAPADPGPGDRQRGDGAGDPHRIATLSEMAEDSRRGPFSGEHWGQLGSIAVMIVVAVIGGAAWIINTVNASGATALAAINAQAAIFAKQQAEIEHRVTTLEAQQIDEARTADRLATQLEQLRGTEGDLTMAVQRLNDLLPGAGRKR